LIEVAGKPGRVRRHGLPHGTDEADPPLPAT
jgi:hypothetical protein